MSALQFLFADSLGEGIVHAFTTRTGGVSEGPYASLNLSWSRGDNKDHVTENRARVARGLGVSRLVFANQVHGDTVLRADTLPEGWSVGEGDALISATPGIALCTQVADCVPVLLHDPSGHAIAAIHSGWRSTVANITARTLEAMTDAYGTKPADVRAAIGPAISKENYRVGPEVLEAFEAQFGALDSQMAGPRDAGGGAGLDVAEAVHRQLVASGVQPGHISRIRACTFADEDRFFSSRRAARDGHPGQFGGQCGIIALKR
ncbi:MAG: peptidoglycan editing factor PgeF [Caulobacterales bacterium]|uniref:peptidoglycan editing factor PgeF n=1 Tax=Glycocaulis sp. TaxID=1969725 RepID=UPI003F9F8744